MDDDFKRALDRWTQLNWYREIGLRMFQQMHQDDTSEVYRASGRMRCRLCNLMYNEHPVDLAGLCDLGSSWANRLCDGDYVHL